MGASHVNRLSELLTANGAGQIRRVDDDGSQKSNNDEHSEANEAGVDLADFGDD